MARLTHLDDAGKARMVDVTDKDITERVAVATGEVAMLPATDDGLTAVTLGGTESLVENVTST